MSSLKASEKAKFEKLFNMDSGYVLHFSDSTFGTFFADFEIEINIDRKYRKYGSSKAKKLRAFWEIEPDHLVGQVLAEMIDSVNFSSEESFLADECRTIAHRLLSGQMNLDGLKSTAETFNLQYMSRQIKRMESSIETDPDLAIGTAKELVETCCKTILKERHVSFFEKGDDLPKLVKMTLKELNLVPRSIPDSAKGSETIKRILSNLSSVLQGIGELRNKYGTGHGRDGSAKGLTSRHAKLVVGSTSAIVHFIFDTHVEKRS